MDSADGIIREHPPLASPIGACKGVGPRTAEALLPLGIETIEHLIYHFPRSYLDRRKVSPIASIEPPGQVVIRGEITGVRSFRPARRRHVTQCVVTDDTGSIKAVWFNQPYIGRSLPTGAEALFSGIVSDRRGLQLLNPDVEVLSSGETESLHTLGLIPLYPLTRGIGHKKMRRLIRAALDEFLGGVPENLPSEMIESERLMPRLEALREIHFPQTEAGATAARKRIAFEEFLSLQLCIQASTTVKGRAGTAHDAPPELTKPFERSLPFDLTGAQRRAIGRIADLMRSRKPMNALLQGDVGCGKTVVALYALLKALENGRQAILMAPTEILAEQHAAGIRDRLGGFLAKKKIAVALLTGSRSAEKKKEVHKLLASGRPALVVGTHALIGSKVEMRNAGLIVIDEQHRFGVNQRAALREKGVDADLLIMTATPIPRTLALTLYGNFETILIDEYPLGRSPIETRHVSEDTREKMYRFIERTIGEGRQAFVVCPEIDPRSDPSARPTANTERTFKKYAKRFPDFGLDKLHGRMPPDERGAALGRFRAGETQILIATTIIEVGMDAPNAAVMVIEDADRFGLAQLHQLRGRVGRAEHQSYCYLMADPTTEEAVKRIDTMISTNDGFKISEQDLLLRGPGEFLGLAQSGIPPLRAGHLIRDKVLLERARDTAREILLRDPGLESAQNEPLRTLLGRGLDVVHY